RVAAILEALVGLRHDLQVWVGEVGLSLVVWYLAERLGLARLLTFIEPFGFLLLPLLLLLLRLVLVLLLQSLVGFLDRGQTLLAEPQFFGQLVTAAGAQSGILGLINLQLLLEQLGDLGLQTLFFFLDVAVAHGLVARGVAGELTAIGSPGAQ